MVFAKHFTFTVPFSTKECKWVAVNRQGGPLRGEVISSSWMGLLAQEQTLHYHCQTMNKHCVILVIAGVSSDPLTDKSSGKFIKSHPVTI